MANNDDYRNFGRMMPIEMRHVDGHDPDGVGLEGSIARHPTSHGQAIDPLDDIDPELHPGNFLGGNIRPETLERFSEIDLFKRRQPWKS